MTTYTNGRIPAASLTKLSVGGRLLPPAAASFERWRALAAKAGRVLTITSAADAYRELAAQERVFLDRYAPQGTGNGPYGDVRWYGGRRYVRVRGAAAAVPGTSNHGRGLAVDIANAGPFKGGFHNWMLATGPALGWSNDEGRSVNEPWHWVYSPAADTHYNAGGAAAEEEDMGTPAENADAVLNYKHPALGNRSIIEAVAALGRVPGDINTVHEAVLRTPAATTQALLGTRIKRAGLGKGETTLAAVLAWTDDYVMRSLNATAQVGGTIDMAQVTKAIAEAATAALGDVEITLTTKDA